MFRGIVFGVFALVFLICAGLALTRVWTIWPSLITTGLFAIAFLIERGRYRTRAVPANARPTGEKFYDPVTKQPVEVYVDPTTGERFYANGNAPANFTPS